MEFESPFEFPTVQERINEATVKIIKEAGYKPEYLKNTVNQDVYNESVAYNYINEADIKRSEVDSKDFGLPAKKKYPMPDEKHVKSAIKFFNYVDKEDEEELAKNIKKKIKQYNITDISVGAKNRFSKYYKSEEKKKAVNEYYHGEENSHMVFESVLFGDGEIYAYNNTINSLAYNEYENCRSLLENCIDEEYRPVLEAKLEVLREFAIKDIVNKVKEAFNKLKIFIEKIWGIILEKIAQIKEKIKELKSNRKKVSGNNFETNDKIKKIIDNSTVVQYKIGNQEESVGYFLQKNPLYDITFRIEQIINDFQFSIYDKNNKIESVSDLKENEKYKELESIKNDIKGIEIVQIQATQYNGNCTKHVKSSNNINDLLNLQEMCYDIIDYIGDDIDVISSNKKYVEDAMNTLQHSIDNYEKDIKEYEQKIEKAENDYEKRINAGMVERSKKYASIFLGLMSIVREINNEFLSTTNKLSLALASMTTQQEKINDFIEEYRNSLFK